MSNLILIILSMIGIIINSVFIFSKKFNIFKPMHMSAIVILSVSLVYTVIQ